MVGDLCCLVNEPSGQVLNGMHYDDGSEVVQAAARHASSMHANVRGSLSVCKAVAYLRIPGP
jgi:hypothetical protein